jgi:hypothetical protein
MGEKVFSVQPSLAVLPDGTVCLSGGRPGLFLWLNRDGTGKGWDRIDMREHHNANRPREPILKADDTSSYTEVVAVGERHLLYVYDRIPFGWRGVPEGARETNSVWVVRVTLGR